MTLIKEFLRWPDLSLGMFRVLIRNLTVFKKTWKASIMFNFIEPLLYLSAMGFGLGAYVSDINGLPYLNFIAPGFVASSAMWAVSYENTYGSFIRMDYQKNYQAIIATPLSIEDVVLGDMLYGSFKSVLYGSVILVVIFFLGLVASPWALLLPGVLFFSGLLFSVMGLTWTGLAKTFDHFNYYFTLILTPMFVYSGVFYPLEGMPDWIKEIIWFTPLIHVVNLARDLVLGRVGSHLLVDLAWIIGFTVIFINVPIALIRYRLLK